MCVLIKYLDDLFYFQFQNNNYYYSSNYDNNKNNWNRNKYNRFNNIDNGYNIPLINLPNTLKVLYIGLDYNQTLDVLPDSIEILKIVA